MATSEQTPHKQQQQQQQPSVEQAAAAVAAPAYDASGFSQQTCFCTKCRTLKSIGEFYASCLRRGAFYCKPCVRIQRAASVAKATVALTTRKTASATLLEMHRSCPPQHEDAVVLMLNRLRRTYRQMGGTELGFIAGLTRRILAFWNHTSALGGPEETQESGGNLKQATEEEKEQRDGSKQPTPARELMVWLHKHHVHEPLQPWEVLPVTHTQWKRLRSMPREVWPQFLKLALVAHADARLAELKRRMLPATETI
jgi:hypothetical protein